MVNIYRKKHIYIYVQFATLIINCYRPHFNSSPEMTKGTKYLFK